MYKYNCRNFKHIISVLSKKDVSDGFGGIKETWTTSNTLRASIKPLRIKQLIETQQVKIKATHSIIIRYNRDLSYNNRVKFDDKIYDINSIIDINEEHRYLELLIEEVI